MPLVDDGGTTEDLSRIISIHKGRLPWILIYVCCFPIHNPFFDVAGVGNPTRTVWIQNI